MIEVRQLVRPEGLLVAWYAGPTGGEVRRVVVSCRYVPAVDSLGAPAVALELSYDPDVLQPTGPYYCPVQRMKHDLVAPAALKRLSPYVVP